MEWDEDIAAMDLDEPGKNLLQIVRAFQRDTEAHAEKMLAKEIDSEAYSLTDLENVTALLVTEDPRFVPVVACAFVDDLLKDLLTVETSGRVLGGAGNLFSPYGPFSDLFKRLQLTLAFNLLSEFLVRDLDQLRRVRNEVSHTWNISSLDNSFITNSMSNLVPTDIYFKQVFKDSMDDLGKIQIFRIRVAMLVGLAAYEAPLYARIKKRRLNPWSVLYGPNRPERCKKSGNIVKAACSRIVHRPDAGG